MKISLEEAATRLGKTRRQIRYLIQQGKLPAEKVGGRWFVELNDADAPPERQSVKERQQRQFQAAFEDALELDAARRPRFSLTDLKAFQIGSPLYQQASTTLGADHPATTALQRMLEHLALGCHRFNKQEKAASYREARDEASRAACALALCGHTDATPLLQSIEQDLMAAMAGLLRRLERRLRP